MSLKKDAISVKTADGANAIKDMSHKENTYEIRKGTECTEGKKFSVYLH